ncbi:hypothetical protein D3C75_1217570 [compost metagenome]
MQAGEVVQRHSLLSLLWSKGGQLLAAIGLRQQDLDLLLGLLQLLLTGPDQMDALFELLERLLEGE